MVKAIHVVPAVALCLSAAAARAQDRPFVFSLTTAPDASESRILIDYDVSVGEPAFHTDAENGPEQRIGVQASVGRWTLVSRIGIASAEGAYQSSQQGEALFSILRQATSGASLAVGGGMLREAGGINVALARVVAGRDYAQWRLHGNLLFQKAMASNRDDVDVVSTLGWARRINQSTSLGVEGVGEDLEGFWNPAEAEGGARLLVGPSLHVAPSGRAWQLSVAGGPILHPSNTGRASGALRDLPPTPHRVGYGLRTSLSCNF